ncbi:MAG TPA: energy-coupling factor transporter transmembrane protein EcfT [Nocardioidaceae bacterium]|nr:energy-coupling factor transporter transmembrane protein EcfT [Nocardioidaceae bacterium]
MRPQNLITFPRMLHPGAWWLWALGLAAAASRTQNPIPLLLILAVTAFVVAARKSDAPWARSYGAFLKLALVVIGIRIVFQALLSSGSQGPTVLFTLPEIPVPGSTGIKLGGEVTLEAVLQAFYEGLQLATILVCVGAANSLGSARRLLRSVPGALYEVGIAVVIALTFAPQLVTDAARVRAAHRLRGQSGGLRAMKRLAMPVLEGALDRSVELAAAMDSRGYGRTTAATPAARRLTGLLTLTGLLGLCVGVYGLLSATSAGWLGLPMLVAGSLLCAAGIYFGGRRIGRTTYRPDPWALPEWLVAGSGLTAAAAMFVNVRADPAELVLASITAVPPVPLVATFGILVAMLPAIVAPPLPRPAAQTTRSSEMEVAA